MVVLTKEPETPADRDTHTDADGHADGHIGGHTGGHSDADAPGRRLPRPIATRLFAGIGLLALSLLGVIILGATAAVELTEDPKDPVVLWLDAINERDRQRALDSVCGKKDSQARQFTDAFFADPPEKGQRFTFTVRDAKTYGGNLARVSADILAERRAERWSFTVVEEDGDWKMCSIER